MTDEMRALGGLMEKRPDADLLRGHLTAAWAAATQAA